MCRNEISCMHEQNVGVQPYLVVVLGSELELRTFLMDILGVGKGVEHEETLLEDRSYSILFSLLKEINTVTIAVEEEYVDRIYRDSYYMHFSCKHTEYSRFCKDYFFLREMYLKMGWNRDFQI